MLAEHPKLSLLVGLKNNYDYTLNFYRTTRALYPTVEIVFVSYGSTDGTNDFLSQVGQYDPNLRIFQSDENKTFSDTYNKAIEISTGEFVVFCHNDMVIAPNFLENLQRRCNDNVVVSYTTVEPPIFEGHERAGKMISDFGSDLQTFNREAFLAKAQEISLDVEAPGAGFFCMISKMVLDDIGGGFDNLFNPMFCEDDDLMKRLDLYGVTKITALDAICYHFVSKTSRFSEEYKDRTKIIEFVSNRNFQRKWRFGRKFDVGAVIENLNDEHKLSVLEPYFDNIYYNQVDSALVEKYISDEQSLTKFDLSLKFRPLSTSIPANDILLKFDLSKLGNNEFQAFVDLHKTFEVEGLRSGTHQFSIYSVLIDEYAVDRTNNLAVLDSPEYIAKLL